MSRLSLIALVFVAALCLLEIESKEAPESVEIEEQPTGEEVEVHYALAHLLQFIIEISVIQKTLRIENCDDSSI
ncbi:conserved hypothetical protein [Trichinella spiralis]|uniref:hypothetical protein n=1 Tax=Trichinella spiralis TaxID=6334 RepID=UPI0001EFCC3A|nr:conserved hypothetical protein [Trichinella spiralis]